VTLVEDTDINMHVYVLLGKLFLHMTLQF